MMMVMGILPTGQETSVVIAGRTGLTENYGITTWSAKPLSLSPCESPLSLFLCCPLRTQLLSPKY